MEQVISGGNQTMMRSSISISDIGAWFPEKIVTSQELQCEIERFSHLKDINLQERTGIKERRHTAPDETIVDMVEKASRDVISKVHSRSGFDHLSIDTIIYGGISRIHLEPSTAPLLQQRLGISRAFSFDVVNACLGVFDGIILADSMIKSGMAKNILVASAERASIVMDVTLKAMEAGTVGDEGLAVLTTGDGAVAVLVCKQDSVPSSRLNVVAYSRITLSEYADCSYITSHDTPMITNSKGIVEGSVNNCPGLINDMLESLGWKAGDLSKLVIHQISLPVIHRIAEQVGVPLEKCPITCDYYGNTASVSAPFTLMKAAEDPDLKKGDKIIVCGIGAGLGLMIMAIEVN